MGSYNKINYNMRISKTVERKMFVDLFRKLQYFAPLEEYTYIGFGSTYFSDFNLFHKELNIQKMISIEADIETIPRCQYNIPYNAIELEQGTSTDILPRYRNFEKHIIWLDYDDPFKRSMLEDLSILTQKAQEGTLILFSCNRSLPKKQIVDGKTESLSCFKKEFTDKIPRITDQEINREVMEKDLTKNMVIELIRKMALNEINSILAARKIEVPNLVFKQLISLKYEDGGTPMYTFGGIFESTTTNFVAECKTLPFIKENEEVYKIEVPNLTYKEIHYCNKLVPYTNIDKETQENPLFKILERDIEKYNEIYRYFPNFVNVHI